MQKIPERNNHNFFKTHNICQNELTLFKTIAIEVKQTRTKLSKLFTNEGRLTNTIKWQRHGNKNDFFSDHVFF